jgi:hypothetical protein
MQLPNAGYIPQWLVPRFNFCRRLFLLSRHYPHLSFDIFGPGLQSEEIMILCTIGAQFLVISLFVGHGDTPLALTH